MTMMLSIVTKERQLVLPLFPNSQSYADERKKTASDGTVVTKSGLGLVATVALVV